MLSRISHRSHVTALALLFVCILATAAHAQCPPGTEIRAVDEINTAESELGPTWDPNSGEAHGTFYFQRSASWYLDTVDHVLMQASITTPRNRQAAGYWTFGSEHRRVDLAGVDASAYEIAPGMIADGGNMQQLYCGATSLATWRGRGDDRADVMIFERLNGRFVHQGDASPAREINHPAYWDSHPAALGNVVFFASNRPGGKGGIDIWYVVREGKNKWSAPYNASDINTPYDEITPYLPPTNARTIYYSSNQPRSDGKQHGFDIYVAHRDVPATESYLPSAPLRFPSPRPMECVNTDANELYFAAVDSRRGFYVSDAPRDKWQRGVNFDIYQVAPNPGAPLLDPRSEMLATRNPCDSTVRSIGAEFEIIDITNGGNVVVVTGKVNDLTGAAEVRYLDTYRNNEGIFIVRPLAGDNYFSTPVRLAPNRAGEVTSIPLWPTKYDVDCSIEFESLVQFQSGSSIMQPGDTVRLMEIVRQLDKYASGIPPELLMRIDIDGHTDDRPTTYRGIIQTPRGPVIRSETPADQFHNHLLSDDRARHVREFIESRLQARNILFTVRGHAAMQPVIDPRLARSEEHLVQIREQNRRVEIGMALVRSSQ